jgi:hypothetical protein
VNENCRPGDIVPELHPGVSEVDVCESRSAFVHVTVVPTATFRSGGVNALLPRNSAPTGIVIVDDCPPVGAGVGVGAGEGAEYEPLPHAAADVMRATTKMKRAIDIRPPGAS